MRQGVGSSAVAANTAAAAGWATDAGALTFASISRGVSGTGRRIPSIPTTYPATRGRGVALGFGSITGIGITDVRRTPSIT
jgi:hypothetical protein